MTITTARLFDSYWEVTSPDSEEDNSRAHRFQSARATTAKNRVHQWHEVAYQRTPIDGEYCELRVKIIHEIWYRRNFQNTRARISTARRFGDDWPTSIPRASAPPPGWSVGGRLEGWLVSTTRRLVLAPSHQQRRRRLKNNTHHEQIRFSLFIPFVIFRNIMCYW